MHITVFAVCCALASMFRGSAAHLGVYPASAGEAFAGVKWRFQAGAAVRSSPVEANGAIYAGSSDGRMYALDAGTGTQRWAFDAHSPIASSAAVAADTVYFEAYDGTVYALQAASGKLRWRMRTGRAAPLAWGHESGDFYVSSPAVANGRLYVGGGDGYLYAIDPVRGRTIWRAKTGGRVRSSPAVDRGTVFAGSFDGVLYAFDEATGTQRWRYRTLGADLRSGDFGYDRRSIQSSPAIADGAVVFGSRDGFVYAVDERTGRLRWRFDHHISWCNTSPAIDGHVAFAGSSDGRFIQALDTRTGKELWRFATRSNVFASPSVAGSAVFGGDWSGTMYALDSRSGKELWRYRAQGGRIYSSALPASRALYYGTDDGYVYALRLGPRPLMRAVFADAQYDKIAVLHSGRRAAAYFKTRGYAALDSAGLAAFLRERMTDRAPSVVVFAVDDLPRVLAPQNGDRGLLVRYLQRGGKVVWTGMPPLILPYDANAKARSIVNMGREAARSLFGVSYERGSFDPFSASPTVTGRRWGLSGWWESNFPADPRSVSAVLATDEQGLAAAWLRSFGGVPGTGFVRVPLVETPEGDPENLAQIQNAAEYFPA